MDANSAKKVLQYIFLTLLVHAFQSSSVVTATDANDDWENAKTIYEFTANDIDGNYVHFERYRGKVLLIYNVACQCGLTQTNYEQMKTVHDKFASLGFVQLAFPSNQFMGQEPGSDAEIKKYVEENFGGTGFVDLFSKIDVNGDNAHPIYKWLKSQQHGFMTDQIKWNFSKFLIDRNGHPVKRYAPTTEPKDIEDDIAYYLEAKQEL